MAPWDAIGLDAGRPRRARGGRRAPPPGAAARRRATSTSRSSRRLAGRAVLAIPSTYVQAQLDFDAPEIQFGAGPPGFAVHALLDGAIASYVHTVG